MGPIQHIRRFVGVLAGLAAALVAFGATPAFATLPPPEPAPASHPALSPWQLVGGTPFRAVSRPTRSSVRHARLADHPDRRRGCPARGHGRGARGPGASQPPEGSHRGRLSRARERAIP